ncbi:MAG: WD40/YVTN/BNR-like repeat-containing protein [Bacillota bacterium]
MGYTDRFNDPGLDPNAQSVAPTITQVRLTPAAAVALPTSVLSGRELVKLSFGGKSGEAYIGPSTVAIGTGMKMGINNVAPVDFPVSNGAQLYGIGDSFECQGTYSSFNHQHSNVFSGIIYEPWRETQTLYLASGFKIWKSTDYGKTWTQVYEFTLLTDSIRAFRIVRRNSAGAIEMLVGTGVNDAGVDAGKIYRSTDSGATFTLVQDRTASCTSIRCFAICGYDAGVIIAGGGRFGVADAAGVWRSTDYGATWTWVAMPASGEALANALVEQVGYFSGTGATTVMLATVFHGLSNHNYSTKTVLRSADGGQTWTLPAGTTPTINMYDPNWRGMQIISSTVAVVAGAQDAAANTVTIWRTTDAGVNWTKILSLAENIGTQFLRFVNMGNGIVLAGRVYNINGGNLYYSTDSGATFTKYKDYSASINALVNMGNGYAIMVASGVGLYLSKESGLGVPVTVWEGK